ncbi:TPA: TetR/AcrR family transcriptional regulator [Clostridioides difficile]|uniref:TetR/AcrR family transcriptional regulator n=1 Tax=Clostridioides difficile TaxID=1496 RepID=UPI00097FE80C|nr:TetR/AcrR family transcriptional regulator [Clostridioides difficile]MCI9907069.1 TetR/AcrR family transcriptional regulator [Clostridioides difficile]MCJ0153728.1 TetR/AcrR family transcriptional regulator [Clostridioides difficile]MCO8870727.1 TetR/AcrR family transcriptional regulator [Clostridioides difficile]MCO9000068.1 TetR/AcrR family transcriptional regulator [Clostridioides difficile]MCO9003144.1 TetR/AcrR family transcriptional regulator [Clostridioides difficile]
MAKSFTEIEKDNIRKRLISECEINWSKYGYKKTNIDELCSKSGIAKGSFYTFFDSKEKLFFEVLNGIQNRLISSVDEILSNMPQKEGFAKALKMLYRLYDKNPFLYSPTNTDYITLLNKIPKEMLSQLEYSNVQSFYSLIERHNLKLKIEKEKAFGVCNALLSSLLLKEDIGYDYIEVFDFMVDNLVEHILE